MDNNIKSNLLKIFEAELVKKILQSEIIKIPAGTVASKDKKNVIEMIPIVLKGRISVYKKDSYGNKVLIYNINPAESCIISINSTYTDNRVSTEAYNPVDTEIAMVPKDISQKWLDEYPTWRNFVMQLYTKRLNELINQNTLVSEQKVSIENQNKKITDSITYAKRIQDAVLPAEHFITEAGWEHFIFFKPRDIVSGDFYWIAKEDDNIIIAAADATGHGVPGAFMSMLGIAFLNELKEIMHQSKLQSNVILEKLRTKIKNSLKQTGKQNEAKDGMDIALCIINTSNLELQFAGAHNPLYIIRNENTEAPKLQNSENLITIKPDRQPIGIHLKEKPFTNKTIQLEKNDTIYLFSDGYKDQFGGEKGSKFKSYQFKKLLSDISSKAMNKQKEILINTFEEWKGSLEQVDDVLVMGVAIN